MIVAALAVLVLAGVGLVALFPVAVRLVGMPLLCLITAGLVAWIAYRQLSGSDGRMRALRRLMVIGSAFWVAGNVLWLLIGPLGIPRVLVDICFLCAYVPLLGTSVALVRRDTGNPDRLRMLLDVLVQLLGSGMILWALGLAMSPELMSNLVYLLIDLAMFSILISVCAMHHAAGLWPGLFAIIGGILTALFGDVLVVGGWAPLPMEDGGWIGVVLLAQGFWYGLSARLLPMTDPSATRTDPIQSRGQVVSLVIALLVALAAIVLVSHSGLAAGTGMLLSLLLLAVLMVARALAALCLSSMPVLPPAGSNARRDGPSPSALMRKPFSAPVRVERKASRAPLASTTIEAVTPALLVLILSRNDCRVSVSLMLISTG
jgi:hypothetical protein